MREWGGDQLLVRGIPGGAAMRYDRLVHHRRSVRLQGYDYSRAGVYFVTVCAHNRECLFGQLVDGQVQLNPFGVIVQEEWSQTAILRPNAGLDACVIMPNHVHGIIVLHPNRRVTSEPDCWGRWDPGGRGTLQRAPTGQHAPTGPRAPKGDPQVERFGKPTSNTIPTIVRLFKSATTRRINVARATPGAPVWQRNYYEHVIRDEGELDRIRGYIAANPARWCDDMENPYGNAP